MDETQKQYSIQGLLVCYSRLFTNYIKLLHTKRSVTLSPVEYLTVEHSKHLKKRESQSTEISHTFQNKFKGNSNIRRKFLKSSKDCLAFPENGFCIRRPNLAF